VTSAEVHDSQALADLVEPKKDKVIYADTADISWEEYSQPNALQFAEVGGYTLAHTLIQFIVERYGWDAVVRLVPRDASMEKILGSSPRKLFNDWKVWLDAQFSG
jgi:hypothetical protein